MDRDDYERYYRKQHRWRVEFKDLAYDGGGSASWTQYYRTKFGAYFSMYRNVYISSWGGKAELYDNEDDPAVTAIHRISH